MIDTLLIDRTIDEQPALESLEQALDDAYGARETALSGRHLLVAGNGAADTYMLVDGETLLIGRHPACDIPLTHSKVSRRHAQIHVGKTIEIEDLGSRNGTQVGGRRLPEGVRRLLEPGTGLQIGPYIGVVVEAIPSDLDDYERAGAAIPVSDPTEQGVPDVVRRVAAGQVSVLITGETGVGKEVLARTVHELSGRSGQFVAINCASLSATLLESDLFGHERGSFTGAGASKSGLFEVATGGSIFLDEIGELSPGLQAKLLRVLETRTVYRVGGVRPVNLDVRFIAATHRDLAELVTRGEFRRDLYFRVNGISLTVVPLRARRESIPALAAELLARATPPEVLPPRLSESALDVLVRHDWPGNVRELRTVMERAAVLCNTSEVSSAHILVDQAAASPASAPTPARPGRTTRETTDAKGERERVIAALAACAGNQTQAARMLGISRTTLVHKIEIHRIPRPRKRKEG